MANLSQRQQSLLEQELKLAKLKEQELLCELEYKTKSLTTYALSMVQKNEMLREVKENVELLLKKPDNQSEHAKKLTRTIEFELTLDKDWDEFKMYFQEVQTDFFPRLKERFPDLTAADLKLCALVKLNLSMKQTAAVLRISPDSVKVARHRLKKKFNLPTVENLNSFVMSL
jgi:FixJ family two-component response regulator